MNLITLFILAIFAPVSCAAWSYDDTTKWPPLCSEGTRQSPINMVESTSLYKKDMAIEYAGFDAKFALDMINNGHSVKGTFTGINGVSTTFQEGKYYVHHFHLHWGKDKNSGSEHTVDGKASPGELHLVHYNSKYGSLEDALEKKDGLLVIGAFIEVGPESLLTATEELTSLDVKGKTKTLSKTVSAGDVLPSNKGTFWHYNGSLTTPGCFETVTWIVLEKTITLPETVFARLRTLSTGVNKTFPAMTSNYRKVQALNNRTVQRNFKTDSGVAVQACVFLVATMQILVFIY